MRWKLAVALLSSACLLAGCAHSSGRPEPEYQVEDGAVRLSGGPNWNVPAQGVGGSAGQGAGDAPVDEGVTR